MTKLSGFEPADSDSQISLKTRGKQRWAALPTRQRAEITSAFTHPLYHLVLLGLRVVCADFWDASSVMRVWLSLHGCGSDPFHPTLPFTTSLRTLNSIFLKPVPSKHMQIDFQRCSSSKSTWGFLRTVNGISFIPGLSFCHRIWSQFEFLRIFSGEARHLKQYKNV